MKEFICIVCPRGCHIFVDEQNNMTGNLCKRGLDYVKTEMTDPKRILTSTVKTIFKEFPRVSVKTDRPIPKQAVMKVMDCLTEVEIRKPMSIGEIVIENVLDTGANIVLTGPCLK